MSKLWIALFIGLLIGPKVWAADATPSAGQDTPTAKAESAPPPPRSLSVGELWELKLKVEALEKRMERLEIDTELLNTKSSIVVQRTAFSVLDRYFLRTGAAMVRPSGSTFSFKVATGIGAYIGGGRYFGRNHVAELGLDYDLYLSMTARYRLEFHVGRTGFTFGPVLGYKQKLVQLQPWGNNISNPDLVKSNFFLIGALFGIPIGRVLVSVEMDYLFNSQVVINTIGSAHILF